eukprot:TRINITY_DN10898_c0_g1_i1.p2 TRINITY_DN10898_c0_g1~~TRINITY_DN10898_c0_g1_i1.p2  ORF type:complete len:235 (-),score=63.78 TRINITY_DN10898_c0_g1_i1:371-1075(-)
MHEILALPAGCPYAAWQRPNIRWCEQMQCSYVVTPINAWSNVFYLAAALCMYVALHRPATSRRHSAPDLGAVFAAATVITGLCSFSYHATYTYVFQIVDFCGMFAFLSVALALALQRARVLPSRRLVLQSTTMTVAFSLMVPLLAMYGVKYQIMIVLQVLALVVLEFASGARDRTHMWRALTFIVLALSASVADQTGAYCDPASWVQGHAVWHLLSAVAMFYQAKHCVLSDRRA